MKKLFTSLLMLSFLWMTGYSQTYFSEDFNDSIPSTWTTTSAGTAVDGAWFGTDGWQYGTVYRTLDSTNYVMVDTPTSNTDYEENLESPGFTVSGGNIIALSFDQYYYNYNYAQRGYVEVYNGLAWDTVYIQEFTIGNYIENNYGLPMDHPIIDITAFVNTDGTTENKVRFSFNTNGGPYAYYWYLDNVEVSSTDCIPPAHSTVEEGSVQVIIDWDFGNGNTTLIYGAVDFDPLTEGTTITGTTSPYNLTGLSEGTSFEYYLLNDCGVTDSLSMMDGPYSFTTTVGCPSPYLYTPYGADIATNSAIIEFSSYGIGQINLIYGLYGYTATEGDTIFDIYNGYVLEGLADSTRYSISIYMDCDGDGLGQSAISGPRHFYTLVPCPTPTLNNTTEITTNSALVTYTTYGPGDVYMIIGDAGFIPGEAGDTLGPLTSPYQLTDLTPLSFYDMYLYMDCESASDGISISTNAVGFTTLTDGDGTGCENAIVLSIPSVGNSLFSQTDQSICGYGNNVTTSPCQYAGYDEIVFAYNPTTDDEVLGIYASNFEVSSIYMDIVDMCPDAEGASCVTSAYVNTASNENYLLTTDGIDLDVNTTYFITISASTYNGCTLDMQIFLIDCATPTDLTFTPYADSTVVSWNSANDSSVTWQLEWGFEGFTLGDEDATIVEGTYDVDGYSYSITGLSDTIGYDFYVLDQCGFQNVSIPAGPSYFTGPPPVNDLCTDAIPLECGDDVIGNTTSATNIGNPVISLWDDYYRPQNATVWYSFVGTGSEIVLSTCGTDWNTALYVYTDGCEDSIMTAAAYAYGDYYLGADQCDGPYGSTYLSMQTEAGVNYTVAVCAGTTYNPPTGEFYLSMNCVDCSAPSYLDVVTQSDTEALFTWDSFNDGADYSYEYGLDGYTPGTDALGSGTGTIVGSEPTMLITGLNDSTMYDVYLWENCTVDMGTDTIMEDFTTNNMPPPANDLCINASVIACGESDTTQTSYATEFGNPAGPLCGSTYDYLDANTVWWQFVGTGQEMNLGTCGSYKYPNSTMYTELFIFTGDCEELICEERSYGNSMPDCPAYGETNISIYGEEGVTYYVAAQPSSSYYSDGEIVLTLTCIDCSTPIDVNASLSDITADISWTSFNSPIEFTMYWDTSGVIDFPSTTGNMVTGNTGTDMPVALTDLLPGGTYEVYVIEHCTDTTTSDTVNYSFTTNLLPSPTNDDACNAIALIAGDTLETTNIYASVQMGEVEPPQTSYTDPNQMGWGYLGLDATTWYTFTPSMTGTVKISTCHDGGYDTQLAVYEVEDCADFSTYTLIRANDDQIGGCDAATYASTVDNFCLAAGVTYYIQVDPYSHSNIGQSFSISVEFAGAEITDGIAFPGIYDATVTFTYFNDLGGDTDYSLVYSSATTTDTVSGNTADLPLVLDNLDDDTEYEFYILCDDFCGTSSDTYNFTTILDGISTLDFGKNVSVYPNPSSDKITIEINADVNAGSIISIISMQGKVLYQEILKDNTNNYSTEIDVNNFARGIYLLKLEDDNSSIQQRIIVQ